MPEKLRSFNFSADTRSRVLILGSMPGVESLRQQQYYAHPRNLFWTFMGELFGAKRELPYEERLAILRKHGVALWDAAHRCQRGGSLDLNISDVEANDFAVLFVVAPQITTIFFNGQKAAELFRKLVDRRDLPSTTLRTGGSRPADLRLITLPSTSPANAAIPVEKRRVAWKQVSEAL